MGCYHRSRSPITRCQNSRHLTCWRISVKNARSEIVKVPSGYNHGTKTYLFPECLCWCGAIDWQPSSCTTSGRHFYCQSKPSDLCLPCLHITGSKILFIQGIVRSTPIRDLKNMYAHAYRIHGQIIM